MDAVLLTRAITHVAVCGCLWAVMIFAVLIDLWDRVMTQRRLKRQVTSHRLRKTVNKILEYWRLLLIGFLVDSALLIFSWYIVPYVSVALTIGLVAVEAKSMWEHALERRSGTLGLMDVANAIVNCKDGHGAIKVINMVKKYLNGDATE